MRGVAPWRGVVEGYYGRPWSGTARRDVIRFLAARGMNAFVYGPKHDPWHRARWREPYPADALADLAATADQAATCGVRFVWAVSPALDVRWSAAEDEAALRAKLEQLGVAGVREFALFFDDVPEALADPADAARYGGDDAAAVARAHADLANRVHRWLVARGAPGLALVVPSDYAGTTVGPYHAAFGAGLADGIPVGWTGPAVLATTISGREARARRAAMGGHPVVLWDNYPVNDVVLANSLHLGPLRGRAADLPRELEAHLWNPMTQPYASLVALTTAARYAADPERYDPEEAWREAVHALDAGGGLAVLAEQVRSSALDAPDYADADALRAAVRRLVDAWAGPDWPGPLAAVEAELRRQAGAAAAVRPTLGGAALAGEIAPWMDELSRHVAQALAATRLLRALRPRLLDLRATGGHLRGRAVPPDDAAAARLGPTFAVPPAPPDVAGYVSALGDLLGPDVVLPVAHGLNVHGKRLYLVPRSLLDLEVVSGHNVHDQLLAFVADAWARRAPAGPLSLTVDGQPCPLDASGCFDAAASGGRTRVVVACDGGAPTAATVG